MCSGLKLVEVVLGVTQAMRVREQESNERANMRSVQLTYSLLMCPS
jgi:hypothetical protein